MLSWGRKTQRQQEWHLLHPLGKGNTWREAGNIDGSFAGSCCIQESMTSSVHRMLYKGMGLHQRIPRSQSRRYLLQKQSVKTVMLPKHKEKSHPTSQLYVKVVQGYAVGGGWEKIIKTNLLPSSVRWLTKLCAILREFVVPPYSSRMLFHPFADTDHALCSVRVYYREYSAALLAPRQINYWVWVQMRRFLRVSVPYILQA